MENIKTQTAMQAIDIYQSAIKDKKEIYVSKTTGNLRIETTFDYVKIRFKSLLSNTPMTNARQDAQNCIKSKLKYEITLINKDINKNENESINSVINEIFYSIEKDPLINIRSSLSREIEKLKGNNEEDIKGSLKLFYQIENEMRNNGEIEENFWQNELKNNRGDLSEALAINDLAIRLRKYGEIPKNDLIPVARQINFAMNTLRLPYKEALALQKYANRLKCDNKFPKGWSSIEIMDAAQAVKNISKRDKCTMEESISLIKNRKESLKNINKLLPKEMELKYISEGIEISNKRNFTLDIIDTFNNEIKDLKKEKLHEGNGNDAHLNGLEAQFARDFFRNIANDKFIFIDKPEEKSEKKSGEKINLDTTNQQQVIENFKKFCNPSGSSKSNSKAAETVSRYLSQTTIGSLMNCGYRTIQNGHGIRLHTMGMSGGQEYQFTVQRVDDDKLIIRGVVFTNGSQLIHAPLPENPLDGVTNDDDLIFQQLFIIPPAGEGGRASRDKFSTKFEFSLEVSQADMDEGVLNQTFPTPPSITNRFVLDWAKFDSQQITN